MRGWLCQSCPTSLDALGVLLEYRRFYGVGYCDFLVNADTAIFYMKALPMTVYIRRHLSHLLPLSVMIQLQISFSVASFQVKLAIRVRETILERASLKEALQRLSVEEGVLVTLIVSVPGVEGLVIFSELLKVRPYLQISFLLILFDEY